MGRHSPEVSHLFFVDDLIIFARAMVQEVDHILSCINTYENAFGQRVNLDKIELTFSQNVPNNIQTIIQDRMGVKVVGSSEK